jgi:hypothetical protein
MFANIKREKKRENVLLPLKMFRILAPNTCAFFQEIPRKKSRNSHVKELKASNIFLPRTHLNRNYGISKLIDDAGSVKTLNPFNEVSSDISS